MLRLALLFVVVAGCATTPEPSPAKAYLDRAEPLHCEVVVLESRLNRVPADSEESVTLSEELAAARARVKSYYRVTWPEYMERLMELPFEERQKLYAYSAAVEQRCAAQDRKASPWR
jgi:hypothetical protein